MYHISDIHFCPRNLTLFIPGHFPICKLPLDKISSSSSTWSLHHILWPRRFKVFLSNCLSTIFFFLIQQYVTKVSNPKLMWRQDTKLCEHAAICNNLWWVVFKYTKICNNYHLLKGHKPGHFLSRQRCRFRGQRWISLIILIITTDQTDFWKHSM